jgi:DNA-binding response OmpR family regulator
LHIVQQELIAWILHVIHSFDYQMEKQEVKFVFHTNVQEVFAWFDPDAIDKILYNLISNSLKACAKGAEITVKAQVVFDDFQQPLECVLSVKDTGVGIPEDQLPNLFQRFFQTNIRRFGSQAGTGVGLALVSELVEIHNGQIHVESQIGDGTTFSIHLPIYAAAFPDDWISGTNLNEKVSEESIQQATVENPEEPLVLQNNNKIILLAEDDPEMRAYLADNLERAFTVIRCENGQEGLIQSIRYLPDLIISDLLMPEMDGAAFCKAIKENEKTSHIPFVLLTSRSLVESQIEGFQVGADDYLTKPFNFDLLFARVLNLLEQRRLLRERFVKMPLHSFQASEIEITATDEQFLKKAIQAIEDNISNVNFNVEQLEEAMSMSKMQLYRKLTFFTNMGGNAFIRHVRLQRAAQLLEKSNLTVAEIAYQVGFNSPSYFTKAYKKEFGKLPSAKEEQG